VPDGAVLTLAEPAPPPVVHDDPADAVARTAPPGEPPRWLPAGGAALLLLLGALTATAAGEARTAAVAALLLFAGALLLGRAAPEPAVLAATAACANAAVAAGLLAAHLRPDAGVVWAARGVAALALASLATVWLASRRLRMLPTLVAGTAAALIGAVLSVRTVPLTMLACVLLVLTVLLSAAVPWLAVGLISRPHGRLDPDRLAAQAGVARELVVGLAVGLGIVQAVLTPVVAGQGARGLALAASASAFVLLRARHHAAWAEALPGVLAGGLGLLATAGVALWWHQPWRPAGALVLTGAGGVLLTRAGGPRPPLDGRDGQGSGALVGLALRALEAAFLAALLPLLVLATHATEALG
jgi:hypothetical protein